MPARSKVEQLPDSVRADLDARLIQSAFGGYRELAEWLQDQGYEIHKSALHAYGQRFEERMASLKLVTQQARAVVEHSPDDEGAVSEALMRLVQEKLFTVLMDLEVDPQTVDISKVAKSIAELGRASVTQKKYAAEVRNRAKDAAEKVAKAAKSAGMSAATVNELRAQILGIPK